jgi:hypothetical protein
VLAQTCSWQPVISSRPYSMTRPFRAFAREPTHSQVNTAGDPLFLMDGEDVQEPGCCVSKTITLPLPPLTECSLCLTGFC